MAAQAVDFSISGHVNRGLFLTSSDNDGSSNRAAFKDNASSGTRIRAKGSSELEGAAGSSVGFLLEYAAGSAMTLRHAAANIGGDFGTVTVGQTDPAGNYKGNPSVNDVWGIGVGQDMGGAKTRLGAFFSSFGASRHELIKYDTPSLGGLVTASVSVGKTAAALPPTTETVGVSTGGTDLTYAKRNAQPLTGALIPGSAGKELTAIGLDIAQEVAGLSFSAGAAYHQYSGAGGDTLLARTKVAAASGLGASLGFGLKNAAQTPAMPNPDDPTFFEATIGYAFGPSAIGLSWYSGEDIGKQGSSSTAFGVGAHHTMAALGTRFYAAVQNYDVETTDANDNMVTEDQTVVMIGARVEF